MTDLARTCIKWVYHSRESAGYDCDGYDYTVCSLGPPNPLCRLADYLSSLTPKRLMRELRKEKILR